jgi:branched-chain amino acid transport system substrate-binding protein
MATTGSRVAALAALVILAACGGSSSQTAQTDVGVTATEILLGNTNALSGSASAYGTISNAAKAYYEYINGKGGVNGRKITYKVVDDVYNPANTVPLTKQLVEQDKVFAVVGGLGTQTQTSVRDYLNAQKVPQMFVFTGATTWGADFAKYPWTIGWIPAYQAEARIYANDVVKNHAGAKIGVLYQNDDYGLDYLKGFTDGLGSNASMVVDKESYDVTAASLSTQLVKIKATGADTLALFSTPKFTIQALATITALHWEPTIYLNSVSNTTSSMGAAKTAGAALKNVLSTVYAKDPKDQQWANDAGMKQYREIVATCSTCKPEDGFNVIGMAQAFATVDVLRQAGSNMTRANVMKIASSGFTESNNPFILPGVVVKTTPTDHFPIMQMNVETWNGTGWALQGGLVDMRGTIK